MKKIAIIISLCLLILTAHSQTSKRSSTSSGTKVRSAETGRYVKKSEATKNPKTTVTETTKSSKGGRKK